MEAMTEVFSSTGKVWRAKITYIPPGARLSEQLHEVMVDDVGPGRTWNLNIKNLRLRTLSLCFDKVFNPYEQRELWEKFEKQRYQKPTPVFDLFSFVQSRKRVQETQPPTRYVH